MTDIDNMLNRLRADVVAPNARDFVNDYWHRIHNNHDRSGQWRSLPFSVYITSQSLYIPANAWFAFESKDQILIAVLKDG